MANNCFNQVVFAGPDEAVVKVNAIFSQMAEEQKRDIFQWPDFIEREDGFMFDPWVGENSVGFTTRRVPNLEVVKEIADHFGVDYNHYYDEMMMGIMGEAMCHNGAFHNVWVAPRDLKGLAYDDEKEMYTYQGEAFDDDYELWQQILEAKKEKMIAQGWLFETTNLIRKDQLRDTYGPLLEGDMLLKLAEQKNFESAAIIFDAWDEETIVQMENYLIEEYRHIRPDKFSNEEYIALKFLDQLISEWDQAQKREQQAGLKR